MTLWKWSRTAATNATADSTCPFPEGMNPGALNDGTRGMMAAAAKYRDDISGGIVTGGTSTAYTVSSYQGFDTLAHLDGQMIAFTAHTGNGGTCTLNVDGLGAKPLRSAPGLELPTAALIQGTSYVALFNNTDSVFYLRSGLSNPYSIPLGGYLDYSYAGVPNSAFAMPYGQALSRTVYSAYFGLVGTKYGAGDGTMTFNIPDRRGCVAVTSDNMVGASPSAGRSPGYEDIGVRGGAQTKTLALAETPAANLGLAGTPATINVSSIQGGVVFNAALASPVSGGATFNTLNMAGVNLGTLASQGAYTPAGTVFNGGGNVPFSLMQASFTVNTLLRVI